jgi:hypothetical protein
MPSARAVCRLMTNWNLVDCCAGRSPGLAPLRMLPVRRPFARAAAHPSSCSTRKSPGRGGDQALSGRRRGAYCTRNVDPKALPQASSAFRSVVCENIPNIAPHIAANIRIGMVYLRLHSDHQLSRGLRSSIQNRSSTNINLYKIDHCNLLRSELCLPYSIPRARCPAVKCIN